ncbi:MAG: NusG domain II-containing protein [Oscillospiraceae bacterium]|nr:NusG domain II-containing protein [Oscillospiraceae bacterium]
MKKKLFGGKLSADVLLIAAMLLLAGVLYLVFASNSAAAQGVVVRIDGEDVAKYSLYENGEYSLNGGSNILVIENGYAWLRDANCPDSLCVKQGKISRTGQVITCLPNRLTVTVYGGEQEVELFS